PFILEAELHRRVAVLLHFAIALFDRGIANLQHGAGPELQHGDRFDGPRFGEHLRHSDLVAEQTERHGNPFGRGAAGESVGSGTTCDPDAPVIGAPCISRVNRPGGENLSVGTVERMPTEDSTTRRGGRLVGRAVPDDLRFQEGLSPHESDFHTASSLLAAWCRPRRTRYQAAPAQRNMLPGSMAGGSCPVRFGRNTISSTSGKYQ